jgi:hypothetical protein
VDCPTAGWDDQGADAAWGSSAQGWCLHPAHAQPSWANSTAHNAGRAELELRLSEALNRLRSEIQRADRLETEIQAAREQIVAIHRDIVLDYLYGLDVCPPLALAILDSIDRDGALVIAQRRVAELSRQLHQARLNYDQIHASLDDMGISACA